MKKATRLAPIFSILILSACATPGDGAKWECSANGLVNSTYDGSDSAYVHLQGFSSGGNYPVKLNEQRTEAMGTTANGTPFKCVRNLSPQAMRTEAIEKAWEKYCKAGYCEGYSGWIVDTTDKMLTVKINGNTRFLTYSVSGEPGNYLVQMRPTSDGGRDRPK